jgi:chemotaxis signal transduction protein
VVQVLRILADQIEPAPPPEKEKRSDHIQELINADRRMISILDPEKIFHVSD